MFWAKRRQGASWLEPCRCMEVNVRLYTLTTSKKSVQRLCMRKCGARWVCLSTKPSIARRLHFRQAKWHLWTIKEEKYCSDQDDVLPRIPASIWLPVATLLPVWWRRWMRRLGGRTESPFCTRFKWVIVFFEAFTLLIKPLPDLLRRRNWLVSISSDCCMFVIQSFAFLLRFFKVTALIQWSFEYFLHSKKLSRIFRSDFVLAM